MNKSVILFSLFITIFFIACEEKDDCPYANIDRNITDVKMTIYATKQSSTGIYGITNELSSVKYENGVLEFDFPEIVQDEYLGEYFWSNSANIIPEGVIISDSQAKVGIVSLSTYNREGINIGQYLLSNGHWWFAEHIYADRNFTIKGSSRGVVYDCFFEKGWNIRYYTHLDGGRYTTNNPSSEEYKWSHEVIGCY